MENLALIGVSLPDVRVNMVIMHVLAVELICQDVMGWVPVHDYLLPDSCGRQRLCLVLPSIIWCFFSRTPALDPLA
jgi:hypothetical protein